MSKAQRPPRIKRWRLDTSMPMHRLAEHRVNIGRDLKIIITAKDSQTGIGKTTLAGWLAMNWTPMFAGQPWSAEQHATLNPKEYFTLIRDVEPGTVVVVDDAEELDARRSMQHLNVDFSQRWMLMRLKQVITIITLPSPSSIDSRLEELADIWINVLRRGQGMVHDIRVQSYGSRNVMTQKSHRVDFPNVASDPEMIRLRQLKEQKMEEWDVRDEEEKKPDPEEVEKQTLIKTAQRMRDNGKTAKEIAEQMPYKIDWVYKHTTAQGE